MTLSHSVSLNDLLTVLEQPLLDQDQELTGLALDSRKLIGGELFLAVPGFSVDGRRYISAAIKAGASAVLAESYQESSDVGYSDVGYGDVSDDVADFNVPVIFIDDLKSHVGLLVHRFYRHSSEQLKLIGVTGTNGKTSCCWFIAQLLSQLGESCAVMGTVGQGVPPHVTPCLNTTSDPVSTQAFMAEMVKSDVLALAMEVSSHGLDQGRVNELVFDVGVFTNLSRDHLDYHQTMEAYASAKSKLFADGRVKKAVINLDDEYSQLMIDGCGKSVEIITFSSCSDKADVYASNIVLNQQGLSAELNTPWGCGVLKTPQLGRFNLENLLAVISAICLQGFSLSDVLRLIPGLKTVPGRMQRLGGGEQPLAVVDYAHTPDALSSVLSALKEHGASRLVCVFGCGGDRDPGKRALMTQAAIEGADQVVVTSDNPRSEDPEQIIRDALVGVSLEQSGKVKSIVDRSKAISFAISTAVAGDIVVIAGKGHEDYQEVMGERFHFDDSEQTEMALKCWAEKRFSCAQGPEASL